MAVANPDAREARAAALEDKNLNGFDFVLVSLAGSTPATLEVHFLNANRLPQLLAANAPPKTLFPISGGQRVRAGAASGEVQVTGTFVQATGSLPIAPAGLSVGETLSIAVGGQSVTAALPAGTVVEDAVVLINDELGSRARAAEVEGRLAIVAERTFDLAVTSSRADPGNGRGTGFDTTPARPPADVLNLVVRPIGDYSTYTLGTGPAVPGFDPVFAEVGFKFRPGCFSTNCAPDWTPAPPAVTDPAIDYLAKDFDSFRHVAMGWMQARVPGWTPTSEADLSQVLLSLMSAAADELSDYQDRVVNEAYLATARSRVSLARHARLLDYHVHQGNQASAWIALELIAGAEILPGEPIEVWAGREEAGAPAERRRGLPRRDAAPAPAAQRRAAVHVERRRARRSRPAHGGRPRDAEPGRRRHGRRADRDRRGAATADPGAARPADRQRRRRRPARSGSCSSSIPARRRHCATR